MRRHTGTDAVIAKRTDRPPVETGEIRGLVEAAGYEVRAELTQVRAEDPGTYFGSGTVDEIGNRIEATGAAALVVDDQLTPTQSVTLRERLPEGTEVFDRYRLILGVFADQVESRRAQRQVELAGLRYALPRLRERSDVQGLNKYAEKGTPVDGVRNRIADLERKLAEMQSPAEQYRQHRREQGFDLVTLAGYTNAGKSTLLHRLADEMDVESVTESAAGDDAANTAGGDSAAGDATTPGAGSPDRSPDAPASNPTAAVEDRLFKTLETTTRRATLSGRPTLVTDTVGFVDDLPHWLVKSFSETLSEAAAADAVVLVVDASDPPGRLREKLEVSLDVLAAQGVDEPAVVTALNKVDLLDDDELAERRSAVEGRAPTPVPVSVTEGTNLDGLVAEVTDRLDTDRLELTLPNCDAAMGLVSRAYDDAAVEDVEYAGERVMVDVRGRPDVLARLDAEAESIRADASNSARFSG
jgi:GTP-binding protein HflX